MVKKEIPSGLYVHQIGKLIGKRPILKGVTLHVRSGESVGLLGPNGAGKTTCFSIISGQIKPDQGEIYLNQQDITKMPVYKRGRIGIGYLPQESSIFRGLNVAQNIMAILELVESDSALREERLESLLEEFSISHLRQTPALALSGGERRRAEIARSLAANPKFLLLDEPMAGIDPIAVSEIQELILHLKKRGIGLLITDHNVRETLGTVDRAYIIAHGQVLTEGTPDEILNNKDVRRVYLGERFSL